jgi:hypothetical protein
MSIRVRRSATGLLSLAANPTSLAAMRRSPLRRPTVAQVRAWERRPRKPLRRRGRKAEREAAAWGACRQAVIERSRGWCEAWRLGYSPVCLSALHGGVHVHHLFPEDRDAGRHDAARCALLCVASHDWAHQNPRAAAKAGLLRPGLLDEA